MVPGAHATDALEGGAEPEGTGVADLLGHVPDGGSRCPQQISSERQAPVGGERHRRPSSIIFQSSARVLDLDDPELRAAAATGDIKAVTGHGELELPDGCILQIALPHKVVTYGLDMSLLSLMCDPVNAAGVAHLA